MLHFISRQCCRSAAAAFFDMPSRRVVVDIAASVAAMTLQSTECNRRTALAASRKPSSLKQFTTCRIRVELESETERERESVVKRARASLAHVLAVSVLLPVCVCNFIACGHTLT